MVIDVMMCVGVYVFDVVIGGVVIVIDHYAVGSVVSVIVIIMCDVNTNVDYIYNQHQLIMTPPPPSATSPMLLSS